MDRSGNAGRDGGMIERLSELVFAHTKETTFFMEIFPLTFAINFPFVDNAAKIEFFWFDFLTRSSR